MVEEGVQHKRCKCRHPSVRRGPRTAVCRLAAHSTRGRAHWSTASPIRTIFKQAFAGAGLPYFKPHSFRKTLALLGGQKCKTPEEYKAWAQNLGHEDVLTTFRSYGDVGGHRQVEIMRSFARPALDAPR